MQTTFNILLLPLQMNILVNRAERRHFLSQQLSSLSRARYNEQHSDIKGKHLSSLLIRSRKSNQSQMQRLKLQISEYLSRQQPQGSEIARKAIFERSSSKRKRPNYIQQGLRMRNQRNRMKNFNRSSISQKELIKHQNIKIDNSQILKHLPIKQQTKFLIRAEPKIRSEIRKNYKTEIENGEKGEQKGREGSFIAVLSKIKQKKKNNLRLQRKSLKHSNPFNKFPSHFQPWQNQQAFDLFNLGIQPNF